MNRRTLLIVDDQSINRRILERLLSDEYNILQAQDGQQAMEVMRAHAPELSAVVLDIVMPVMDGYAVLEAMRGDEKLSKIPVIVSSQQDGDEAEVRALELGAQDFIAKPYKGDIIRHRLHNTIRLRETAAIINRVQKDELTGLYNKQFFLEEVAAGLERHPAKDYDIICLEVERFTLINDTFGVARGDELLCHIADVLKKTQELIVRARFAQDCFYMVTKHGAVEQGPWLSNVLAEAAAFPLELDVMINCGVYPVSDRTLSVSAMCERAKLAADKNKADYGKEYSYYDDSIRQKLLDEQFVIGNVRAALDQHQFQVYYQPKYHLGTERVAGAEALVRWVHPTRGFMSPGLFIPVLERNGLIGQLDEYVWEQTCSDIRRWMDLGLPAVAVSVNVSRADLYNPKLPEILLNLVEKYRVPIGNLHLEITESAYTSNPDQIIQAVKELRSLGFLIEMDDFGSGYSSLNMLAEMPVDVLKLDMGFVQHENKGLSGKGIISFVINLAKWMNLSIVAEGVETADQIAMLRAMDCGYVQGFYFARPMQRAAFEELIGVGNTIEMVWHADEKFAAQDEPDKQPGEDTRKVMLIVDDMALNRAVLASIFRKEYCTVEAEDGAAAWDYLQKNSGTIGVVLLDIQLPVMDGLQLLQQIRQGAATCDLPVLVLSRGDMVREQQALALGADDFIHAPYSPVTAQHRVCQAVKNRTIGKAAAAWAKACDPDAMSAEQRELLHAALACEAQAQ